MPHVDPNERRAYMRDYRAGIRRGPRLHPSMRDRFEAKIDRNGPPSGFRPDLGHCWLWKGAKNTHGHGHFDERTAHAVAYELFVGAIPAGLEIDHLCRVRHCVNPRHLEAVTHKVNMERGVYGMRTHCPRAHPYDGDNLYVTPRGHRQCRICKRERERAFKARRGR